MTRKKRYKKIAGFILIFWAAVSFYAGGYASAAAMSQKRVLFISSYSYTFTTVPDQIQGLKNVFDKNSVSLDIEFMDTKKYNTKKSKQLFFDMLKYKLDQAKPYDAIVVGDDAALEFAVENQKELFNNIPIVFLGVNDITRARNAAKNKYITGIIEEQSIKENIQTAYKLNPKAKRVVAVADGTYTGIGDRHQFYKAAAELAYTGLKFEDINTSKYTYEEIGKKLEELKNDTILLFISMNEDKTGEFMDIDQGIDFVLRHTSIPVYRVSVGGIGRGILGGKMVSYVESGEIAANMVMKIFSGTPVENIEMVSKSPNHYYFDYNILKKFGINQSLLPEGSIIVNRKLSFFEQHYKLVIGSLIVMGFLLILSIVLIIDNLKQRRIERQLHTTNEQLSCAYEKLMVSEEELRSQFDIIEEQIDEITVLNKKYLNSINGINGAIWEMNTKTGKISISGSLLDMFKNDIKHENNAKELLNALLPQASKQLMDEYRKYISGQISEIDVQIPVEGKNSQILWVAVKGKSVEGDKNKLIHGILLDNTKTKNQEDYISNLASHDFLTSLPNRMMFMSKLLTAIEEDSAGAVFLLDIDNFKSINDIHGHIYGDRILIEVSRRLLMLSDDKLFVSRLGGDEFLLLLRGTDSVSVITEYADKILAAINEVFVVDNKENYLECSIGITCYPKDSTDINQLIMNADTAMYKVKNEGKNNYMFYFEDLNKELKERTEIESILRCAIKENLFMLLYQPQVEVCSRRIVGFEALLRIKGYDISPAKFIPIAEETGLIIQIGRWVVKEVIRQAAQWKKKGLGIKPIAINYSGIQMRDTSYLEFLKSTLEEFEMPPSCLEIEITESILLQKTQKTLDFLHKMIDMGIHIALDDFGTGFSSLSYLTYIPVKKIKLDKSMCDKLLEDDRRGIIDSLIDLAHSLDLKITAEGVERKEQYERLKNGGCDFVQGYLFSKPLKIEDAEKLYDRDFTI